MGCFGFGEEEEVGGGNGGSVGVANCIEVNANAEGQNNEYLALSERGLIILCCFLQFQARHTFSFI